MGTLICVCAEASKNCHTECPKGRLLSPSKVYNNPAWPRALDMQMIKELQLKLARMIRRH